MTMREIQGHLRALYGIDVSPELVSAVTDAVLEEVTEWQNRPLEALYPLIFFDAIRIKVRDEGTVRAGVALLNSRSAGDWSSPRRCAHFALQQSVTKRRSF
jgi:transposase-like protein